MDGARTEEVFGGLDADVFTSTLREKQTLQGQPAYQRFWAETAAARREKLMPFFWGTLMRDYGSVAGNRSLGSSVTLTNTHRFSYPGYSEILLGEAHDDTIKSNDPLRNPYTTVLEELQSAHKLTRAQVAVFGSWDVFNAIVEHTEGALTVNAGYEAFDSTDPQIKELSGLQNETPTAGIPCGTMPTRSALRWITCAGPGRASSTSRSARPTTGPMTAATTACSRPTREPITTFVSCGRGCRQIPSTAAERTC